MLTAEDEWGTKTLADDAINEAAYYCPKCEKAVVLKRGRVKIAHFAHKPPTTCTFGEGESALHRLIKKSIYDDLLKRSNCSNVEIEHRLDGPIADIYAVVNRQPVAIEVQLSNLTLEEIEYRTLRYHDLGIAVVWIAYRKNIIESWGQVQKIGQKERYLHTLYYGRVYYWAEQGSLVYPVHLKDVITSVPYYDGPDGLVGGYDKVLKTEKRLVKYNGDAISLSSFRKQVRSSFEAGKQIYPRATLWMDSNLAWWK